MSDRMNRVVVGVDGTEVSFDATHWAAAVAHRMRASLHIVHAISGVDAALVDFIAADGITTESKPLEPPSRTLGRSVLDHAVGAVHTDLPDLSVTRTLACAPAAEALTDAARNARLVVLGCADTSAMKALLVGSTTLRVATHAACPVVAFRGDATTPTRQPVVVGVDHGDHNAVLAVAFEFASQFNVGLIAVNTWSTSQPTAAVTIPYLIDWTAVENGYRKNLADSLAPWIKRYPEVEVTTAVSRESASRALLRHAAEAQLVVVGQSAHGPISGALLGSTSLNLLHHCPVPVMTVRPPDRK